MALLQTIIMIIPVWRHCGLSASELSSVEGRKWRTAYSDPDNTKEGLDSTVWPEAFERMEQFIQDTAV